MIQPRPNFSSCNAYNSRPLDGRSRGDLSQHQVSPGRHVDRPAIDAEVDFDHLLRDVLNRCEHLGADSFHLHSEVACRDASDFLGKARTSVEHAASLLAHGRINRGDFEALVRSKTNLAEMRALKNLGVEKATVDEFTARLVDTVIDGIFEAVD